MVDSVKNAISRIETPKAQKADNQSDRGAKGSITAQSRTCLLYTSDAADD